jgi:multisubunit Na+/H+ antiporter MnhC subunit
MRALCGAMITAGAMIALGLSAQAIGTRYTQQNGPAPDRAPLTLHLYEMDPPLVFALVFAACVAVVGLGITFLGLAYHHHRREREHQWARERHAAQHAAQQRTTV